MNKLAVSADLKRATARWNERERFNAFAELENFRRQTDGLRRVVSNHAVFNRNFGFHLALLPVKRVRTEQHTVKVRAALHLPVEAQSTSHFSHEQARSGTCASPRSRPDWERNANPVPLSTLTVSSGSWRFAAGFISARPENIGEDNEHLSDRRFVIDTKQR